MYEDQNDTDHQAAIAEAERDAHRVIELAKGPDKIPVDGAVNLLRKDPFTQGPRLFAKHCSSCHRYNGHDGRGKLLTSLDEATGERRSVPATAVDLGNFASREGWKRFWSTTRTLRTIEQWFREAQKKEEDGEEIQYIDPENSEMATWFGEPEALEQNKDNLKALVEYLVAEADHVGTTTDDKLREQGKDVALNGSWKGDLNGTTCADCHGTIGKEFAKLSDDDADDYPDIAKYGSAAWLKDFISNPGSQQHYGAKNRMPAYADRMTSDELELLVKWLTGDYYPTEIKGYPAASGEAESNSADAEKSGE